jgi:hydroxymethylglutaryl-CoA reductase
MIMLNANAVIENFIDGVDISITIISNFVINRKSYSFDVN